MSSVITQSVTVRSDPFGGYGKLPYRPNNGVPTNLRGAPYTHPGAAEGEPGQLGALPVTQTARPGKQSNDTVQYARSMPQTGSIHNRLYNELTKDSVVFCHKDGIPNYAGNAKRLSVLRGIGWLNDEMRKQSMGIERDDVAKYMNFVFRTPKGAVVDPLDLLKDADAYTDQNHTNNMTGRDSSIGLDTICKMLTDTDAHPQLLATPSDNSSSPKYEKIADFLRCWRLDGVVLAEDINDLKNDRMGSNHLLFNIVVGGMTNVRNVNISKHSTGTSGVAGYASLTEQQSAIVKQASPQEFDSEPLCGDDFYVALHLNPIRHGKTDDSIRYHFEWRLWSAARWNRIADRLMIRSRVLTTPPPPGGDENSTGDTMPGPASKHVITRASMAADRILEEQLFSTIVGGYRLGTVVDTHAAVMARQDGLGGYGMPYQRCAAVRMSIHIQWHGLLELRQRHGTNCAFANNNDKGEPVVLSSVLSKQGLGCYPVDIGEIYCALDAVGDLASPKTLGKMLKKYDNLKDTSFFKQMQKRIWIAKAQEKLKLTTTFNQNVQQALAMQAEILQLSARSVDQLEYAKVLQDLFKEETFQEDFKRVNPTLSTEQSDILDGLILVDIDAFKEGLINETNAWIESNKPNIEVVNNLLQQVNDQRSRFRASTSFYAFFNDVSDCRDDADNLPRLQDMLVEANATLKKSKIIPKILSSGTALLSDFTARYGNVMNTIFLAANLVSYMAKMTRLSDGIPVLKLPSYTNNYRKFLSMFLDKMSGSSGSSIPTRALQNNSDPIVEDVPVADVDSNAAQALDAALDAAARARAAPVAASTAIAPVAASSTAAELDQLLQANPNVSTSMPPPMQPMPPPPSRKKRSTASDTLEDFVRSTMEDMNPSSSGSSGSSGSSRSNSRRGTPQRQRNPIGSGGSSSNVSSNVDDDEFVDDDDGAGVLVPPPSRTNKRVQRPN